MELASSGAASSPRERPTPGHVVKIVAQELVA
jgi:hypothetical protein